MNKNSNTVLNLQPSWTELVYMQMAKTSATDFSCHYNQVILPFLKEVFELLSFKCIQNMNDNKMSIDANKKDNVV